MSPSCRISNQIVSSLVTIRQKCREKGFSDQEIYEITTVILDLIVDVSLPPPPCSALEVLASVASQKAPMDCSSVALEILGTIALKNHDPLKSS